MPFIALGISCLMAALSAFSLVMVPGEIFSHGLSFWILSLIYPFLTLITCRIFLRFYFKLGSFTPFEYLEYRYNAGIRTLIAGLTFYLRMIYIGMVLFSTSKIFEGAAGWPCWATVLAVGLTALVFTAAGGLKAVVWTDVMQFVVLIGGLFCILGFLFWKIDGGLWGALRTAFAHGRGLDQFAAPSFYKLNPYIRLNFWLLLLGQFIAPISIMSSDQMTVQRLLASGSYRNAVKTQMVNVLLTIPTCVILYIIGLGVFSFYFQHPELTVKSGDTALFSFISTQLPTPLPGLVIAGMMAAVISTLNAVFNSMAAVYVKEFHQRHFNPGISEKRQVTVSRLATATIGAVAIALGLLITVSAEWLGQSVVETSTIFTALGGIAIPVFLLAVLSKRASTLSAWVIVGWVWGNKLAMTAWYMLSTAALKHWKPGQPFGFAGPIGWSAPLATTGAGAAGIMLWLWIRRHRAVSGTVRSTACGTFELLVAVIVLGFGIGLLFWAAVSQAGAQTHPCALSFIWTGVMDIAGYVLIGACWMIWGKEQKKEKYQGLTLFDSGEVVKRKA